MNASRTISVVAVFAAAFAFVESSVVVYLRQLYYPGGFAFPLKMMPMPLVGIEVMREFATIVMLATLGIIAGKSRWQRFGYFLISFGVWDLFFYGWLKVLLDWPASLLEWDILFLIPIPWIGPVLAPALVSVVMIAGGLLLVFKSERERSYRPHWIPQVLALAGSAFILISFVLDTDAALRFQMPKPYHYELLVIGMSWYLAAFVVAVRKGGG